MKRRLSLGYTALSESALIEEGQKVVDGMTKNEFFPTLETSVTELSKALDEFIEAKLPPNLRNTITTAKKNMKKEAFVRKLKALGHAIMSLPDISDEMAITSGYRLVDPPSKRPIPNAPNTVTVFITNDPDVLMVEVETMKDTDTFEVRVSKDKEHWTWGNYNQSRKVMVTDLPTGIILYVQARCKNANGESDWSNIVEARLPLPSEPRMKIANV